MAVRKPIVLLGDNTQGELPLGDILSSIASTIVDGDVDHSPSGDAVFNAIALKQPINNLAGKNVVFVGDSVVGWLGGFVASFADQTKANATAISFIGGTMAEITPNTPPMSHQNKYSAYRLAEAIASENFTGVINGANDFYTSTGFDNRAIASAFSAYDWASADVVVFMFGTNDFIHIGTLGSDTDVVSTSFKGAINYIIETIQTKYPNLRVQFTTPIYRHINLDPNSFGLALSDYADSIIDVCRINRIQVLDLHRSSGINEFTEGEYLDDGLHPSVAGQQLFADRLAPWVMSGWSDAAGGKYAYDKNVIHTTGNETKTGNLTVTGFVDSGALRGGIVTTVPATGKGVEVFTFAGLGNVRAWDADTSDYFPLFLVAEEITLRRGLYDQLKVNSAGVEVNCADSTSHYFRVTQPGTSGAGSYVDIASPSGVPGIIGMSLGTARRDIGFNANGILFGASANTSAPTKSWLLTQDGTLVRSFGAAGSDRDFLNVTNSAISSTSSLLLRMAAGTGGSNFIGVFAPEYTSAPALTGRAVFEGTDSGVVFSANSATANITFLTGTGRTLRATLTSAGAFNLAGQAYQFAGINVVKARKTGWAVATGTATRTSFATTTVTLPQLAERVKALIDDLHATAGHGLIGT